MEGLTFIAAVAVSDPPREGVKFAIEGLRKAGIKVAMVRVCYATETMRAVCVMCRLSCMRTGWPCF